MFDKDNYKKPTQEEEVVLPDWVFKGPDSNKLLFDAVMKRYKELLSIIKSGRSLSIKERRIVVAAIARKAGVDKSLISKRRKPELVALIEDLNTKLEVAWDKKQKQNKVSGKRLTRSDMAVRISRLERELNELKQAKMKEYLNQAIEEELLETHHRMASELAKYRKLYEEQITANAQLRSELRNARLRVVKD